MDSLFKQIMDMGEEEEDGQVQTHKDSPFSSVGFASAFSGAVSSAFSGNTKHGPLADAGAAAATAVAGVGGEHDGAGPSPTINTAAGATAAQHLDDHDAHRAPPREDPSTAQLRHTLQQQKKKYDDLLGDAHTLRSEYDAYQLKMDRVLRQYKQQALQDKHMLEELRLAGASGSMDEAYVTGMKRQIGELQRQLKESMMAAEKAYQRQREAEEARVAAEAAKREELEALAETIAQFHTAPSPPDAAVAAEAAEGATTPADVQTPEAGAGNVADAEAAAGEEDKVNGPTTKPAAPPTPTTALVKAQAQLALRQAEVAELRAQLQQASATHQQQMEERARDLETLRIEIDQSGQRESAQKAAHTAALRKTEADFAEKEAALRWEVETAREQMQKASAEQSTQRVAQEFLATQEREQEERMQAKERELQSLRATLQATQSAVEATHAELREMEMAVHDAQLENRQLQGKADQVSTDLHRSEQQLAQREEDLLDLEKERQRLRTALRQEEEETLRVRQQLTQLQRSEAERDDGAVSAGAAPSPGDGDAAAAGGGGEGKDDPSRLSSVVLTQRQTIQSLQSRIEALEAELTTREVALRRQQAQAQEISTARIEVMKSKEEANARVEQYKEKIQRLEGELAVARQSGAAAAAAAVSAMGGADEVRGGLDGAGGLSSTMERRQFLLEAKRSADSYRISRVRQVRAAFFAVLLLVVGTTLYAAFSLALSPPERYE